MSVTFNYQAPNTQVGGDDVDSLKIYSSSDGIAFTLEATVTITASSTSYIYATGDASTYYRISFKDASGYESPQSDTMYGDDAYMSDTVALIIEEARIDLGDFDSTAYTYTDTQMKKYMDKAVNFVLKRKLTIACFPYIYSAGILTPDPSAQTDNDVAIRNLIMLSMEYIIERGEFRGALGSSIKVRDGDTELDTGSSLGSYDKLIGGSSGSKSELDKAIREFDMVGGGSAGPTLGYY